MHASPDPRLVGLYTRAVICKTFPAYTLESAKHLNAREVMQAMELIDLAQKVKS